MDPLTSTIVSFWLPILFSVVYGGEVCRVGYRDEYCTNGCCEIGDSTICCLSTYTIVGIVFGCIAVICSIAALIFCLCKQKSQGSRVVSVTQPPPHNVWVVNNSSASHQPPHNYSSTYASTQPLPPAYASTYNTTYPSGQPPYGTNTAPPPAYSYSQPSKNPFASAAYAQEARANSVHNTNSR